MQNNIRRLFGFRYKSLLSNVCRIGSFFLNLSKDSRNPVDAVENLCFSPDGHVLAVSWVGGGLAVWTVFGSLLFSTLDSTFHGYLFLAYVLYDHGKED